MSVLADDASVAAFERECQAMGGLSRHPFIVTVMASAFTSDYRPCIVMDLFEQGSYMQLLRRDGPLPLEELLSLSVRVGGALATAHQDGVIHGDVKPQNIFKSAFGYPALGDFGIATLRNRLVERAGLGPIAAFRGAGTDRNRRRRRRRGGGSVLAGRDGLHTRHGAAPL